MRYLVFILLGLLLVGSSANAFQILRGSTFEGDTYTDIVFFWTAESTTLGVSDYSAGDMTATLSSSAAINATAALVGSNGIEVPSSNDFYSFDVSSNDIIPAAGRIGIAIYANTLPQDGVALFRFRTLDVTTRVEVSLTSTGDISVYWRDSGTGRAACASASDPISAATPRFVELAFDTNYREIFVDGASAVNCTSTVTQQSPEIFDIGNTAGMSPSAPIYLDQVMVSNDKTRNLFSLRNLTESPR